LTKDDFMVLVRDVDDVVLGASPSRHDKVCKRGSQADQNGNIVEKTEVLKVSSVVGARDLLDPSCHEAKDQGDDDEGSEHDPEALSCQMGGTEGDYDVSRFGSMFKDSVDNGTRRE
jgi:hypothetical protein